VARAIWTGVLTFGLVSVPVQLYSATEAHEPRFHEYQRGTKSRIRYKRVNERTGKETDYENIVKGTEVSGKLVMLEQDELDSVAPGRSRSMDVQTFVDFDEIDPVHFARTYYLGPANAETKKTYALLRDAMGNANRAAIVRFVMRSKEYLAAVRADGDVLVLETMFFADEVRKPRDEVSNLPGKIKLSRQELDMAAQLIDSMTGSWRPSDYRDTYTDRVNKLIRAKSKNADWEPAEEAPEATNVTSLMEALQASVDAAKSGRGRSRKAAEKTTAKKTTAEKTTAKKSTSRKGGKKRSAA
jgi:DNA end-binding protein Ku